MYVKRLNTHPNTHSSTENQPNAENLPSIYNKRASSRRQNSAVHPRNPNENGDNIFFCL